IQIVHRCAHLPKQELPDHAADSRGYGRRNGHLASLTELESGLSSRHELQVGGTRKMLAFSGMGDLFANALPPSLPLVTNTIHTLGMLLLVAIVALPGLTLFSSVLRDSWTGGGEGQDRPRRKAPRLCTACGSV